MNTGVGNITKNSLLSKKFKGLLKITKRENKSYFGFTMAEVLITIGVLGIVAAMTLPGLIANHRDKVLEAQKAKAKNTLANSFRLMMGKQQVFKISNTEFAACVDDQECMAKQLKKYLNIVDDNKVIGKEYQTKYEIDGEPQ